MKSIHFSSSNPVCHAFDQDAKDGHDLVIGLNSGDGKVNVQQNQIFSYMMKF